MRSPSTIAITYDQSTDITQSILYADASFEGQIQAVPGVFSFSVKDPTQTFAGFTTGREITVDVDGVRLYGGFILQSTQTNFFPVVDTSDLSAVTTREWKVTGVDYNRIFDKRVLYDHTNPINQIVFTTSYYDGHLIRNMFPTYFDIPSGFDFTDPAFVHDIVQMPLQSIFKSPSWAFQTPGSYMRDQLEDMTQYQGAFYYLQPIIDSGDGIRAKMHWEQVQSLVPTWGFSDNPVASAAYDSSRAWIGFREGSAIEDATGQVDDAFVWGGGAMANSGKGGITFGHALDAPTIAENGRWQFGEVHNGDQGFISTAQVQARANTIVSGTVDGSVLNGTRGLLLPEKQFQLAWFAHDVPQASGVPQHLLPGAVTTLHLWTFSEDGGTTPFILTLPLKTVRTSFPTLPGVPGSEPETFVRFDGFFGIGESDPFWLWDYLIKAAKGPKPSSQGLPVAVGSGSNTAPPGAYYSGTTVEVPDGTTTVFHIQFPYVPGTLAVFLNGLDQRPGIDFTETDPTNGEFTFTTAPLSGDTIIATARTLGSRIPSTAPSSIDATGATDVTTALTNYLNSLPAGSVCAFDPSARYRVDSAMHVNDLTNVVLNGQGCTIFAGGSGYTEESSIFYLRGNSNMLIENFVLIGTSPTPGVFISGEEGQHGVLMDGGSGYEVTGCTGSNFYGDFVEVNSGTDGANVHDNVIPNTGRNGISVIWGTNVLFQRNACGTMGYMPFDVEPNTSSEPCTFLAFDSNTVTSWTNLFFATDGSATGADIHDIAVTNNQCAQSIAMEINPSSSGRESNITITGNVGSGSVAAPAILVRNCDTVVVQHNTQTVSGSPFVSTPGSTGVTDTPNP